MKSQIYAALISLVDMAKVAFFQNTILERTLNLKWRSAFKAQVFIPLGAQFLFTVPQPGLCDPRWKFGCDSIPPVHALRWMDDPAN